MIAKPGFAGRCLVAALVVASASGVCGCVTLTVDDLSFVSLKKWDAKARASHPDAVPRAMLGDAYADTVYIEATLSTSHDLVAWANRDNSGPQSWVWQCSGDSGDDRLEGMFRDVYDDGRRVVPLAWSEYGIKASEIAQPRAGTSGRYFYTIFFESKSRNVPGRYDLAISPVDVCAEFTTRTNYNYSAITTNVVTIPAAAFKELLTVEQR